MVGSALLRGHGYRTGVVDELLEGADLLLLAPRLDEGTREAFVGAMGRSDPRTAGMTVIALRTGLEGAAPQGGGLSVPWPWDKGFLVDRSEAARLAEASPEVTL